MPDWGDCGECHESLSNKGACHVKIVCRQRLSLSMNSSVIVDSPANANTKRISTNQ